MEFKPVLRFAVMSDVHFCKEHPERRTTLKKAVKEVYKYSENEEYKKLDALYVVGDFTDRGKREEMEWFYADCTELLKQETLFAVTMANHELHYMPDYNVALKDFKEIFDMPYDRHEKINGYHFISLSAIRDKGPWDDSFNDEKKAFLKEELEKARADTGNKPIFVFQHAGIPETIVGGGWEELCELCDELNSDKIGICWDFGHANTANLSQEKALGEIGNRLKITHVHDNSKNGDHHQLPLLGGDEWGCINWTETMSAVKSINYKGPLTLELIYPPKQMLEGFIKCCFDSLECLKNM